MKLELIDVNKSFSDKQVLHDINFTVESGRAMGFLGRNGAGKTTTIRCIMKVFNPDSGQILMDGKKFQPKEYPIGYLPEERGLYQKEKILDQLLYLASIRGVPKAQAKENILYWLKRVELDSYLNKNLEVLSKGNQQKVQIIQCFIHDPEIIILDEPFSGLDPVNSQVLKDMVREKIKDGKLVVFSSHQMSYVEEFCDDITLIDEGRIVLSGSLDQIQRDMSENKVRINAENRDQLRADVARFISGTIEEDRQSLILSLEDHSQKELLRTLLREGVEIESFAPYKPSLTEIFIKKVGGQDA